MLLDTIQRLQANSIKLVSIEGLRQSGRKVPPQVHSVPALMIMPSKQLIFGKNVFDYLLLPGKGVLTTGMAQPKPAAALGETVPIGEPQAFTMNLTNSSGDNFAFIEDDTANAHRNYTWTPIEDVPAASNPGLSPSEASSVAIQSNTRVKKEILDLEEFKARRAEDLNVVVNTNVTPPPAITY
jgi:hypothetical protein